MATVWFLGIGVFGWQEAEKVGGLLGGLLTDRAAAVVAVMAFGLGRKA